MPKQDKDPLEEPKPSIRIFIQTLLRNGVHLVRKFETWYQ